jgi:hypothetical protein
MERLFLKTLLLTSCFLFQSALFAQNEPVSVGIGLSPGAIFNLPSKSGNASALSLRMDGRIPILSPLISTTLHTGWDYCLMRVESNNAGKTLQTARGQYLRAGMNLNLRLYTSKKQTGLELGGGILFRSKFYESSDWQLTGGQPIRYFPKNVMMAPIQIFTELTFNTGNTGNLLNGMWAGIQYQWFAKQRKQYFKGTHRTLQWDDIWPAQTL